MEITHVSRMSLNGWSETATDEHLFLEGDVEAVRYAVYSSECDLTKSKLSTNYAVLAAAKKLDQLKGQGIQFVTFLTEAHSLLAVFTPGSEYVTFVVVHGRKNVNVVNKFNWKTFSCPEGGIAGHFDFIATTRRRLPSNLFTATVSCQGLYAIILGPSEHSNVTDHITEFVPAVNLLHGHTWDVEPLHLPHDTWPSQTVFDPRPCQEHIAYVILSPHSSYDYSKRLRQGPLYLYDVRDGQLLQICSSVCFVQCLLNGRQLLVADREVDTYHNRRWLIKVLDSATFDVIFKVNIHTQVYNLSTQTMAFYSSDYKKTRFCGMARQRADPGTGNTCVCHDFIHGRDMFIFDDSQGNLSCHHLKIPDGPPYGI